MLNCRAATELLSAGQDRRLSLTERMGLKLHVMMCKGCSRFASQMMILRRAARAYARGSHEHKGERGPASDRESSPPAD